MKKINKNILLIIVLLVLVFIIALVGFFDLGPKSDLTQCERNLAKTDFFQKEVYTGTPASVDFISNPNAGLYYTAITNAVKQGANFAGKYSIASWSCGNACQNSAIVDVTTGKIVSFGVPSQYGYEHSATSTLLVLNSRRAVNGMSSTTVDRYAREYYTIDADQKLQLLCSEKASAGLK